MGHRSNNAYACQPLSCPAALLHSPSFLSACDPAHAHLIIIAVAAQKNLHPTMESPSRIGSPFLFFLPTETGIAQPGIGNGHETAVIFNGLAEGLKKKEPFLSLLLLTKSRCIIVAQDSVYRSYFSNRIFWHPDYDVTEVKRSAALDGVKLPARCVRKQQVNRADLLVSALHEIEKKKLVVNVKESQA